MAPSSVRARTTTIAVVCFAVATAVAAVVMIIALRGSLLDEIDRALDSRAADIAAQVASETEFISLGAGIDADTVAVVFGADGAIFDSTDISVDPDILLDTFEESDVPFDVSLPHLNDTEGADNLRAVVLVVGFEATPNDTLDDDDYIIYVATSLDPFDRTVGQVTLIAAISSPVLVLIVALLTWILTGRSLAPVEALRREVDEITDSDLHRRVTEPGARDEIARLAATMNEMLARLEVAQQTQRQFVADASHELRSPLASMAARIDVAMRHGDSAQWSVTASELRDDVSRMHHLVEDLLLLATSGDAPDGARVSELVDLDTVVLAAVRDLAIAEGPTVDSSGVSAGLVRGDRTQLQRVVTNLITNARRHARSTIVIALHDRDGVELTVADDGPGIALQDRERIFERFVRLDEGRSRDIGGTGLGLAICREVVNRHGGALTVSSAAGGGAVFTIKLPSAS